jgi:hypothetical protein
MAAALRPHTPDHVDRRVEARRALHAEIKSRWNKFTDFELGALADNGDLINQVAIKYGLELSRARTAVTDLLKAARSNDSREGCLWQSLLRA